MRLALALLASAVARVAGPDDASGVTQNFDAMLKQMAEMHKFIEAEETQKRTLEARKKSSDDAVAKVEGQNTQLRGQMQALNTRFQKVEGAWVKTAVELSKLRKSLQESEKARATLAKENADMKAQLARIARDWESVQSSETSAANKLSADWNGLSELEHNDTVELHIGPPPQEAAKVPVLSPLFTPRPGRAAARSPKQQPALPAAAAPAPAAAAPSQAAFDASFLPSIAAEVPFSIDALDAPQPAAPPAAAPAQSLPQPTAPAPVTAASDFVTVEPAAAPALPSPTSTQVAAAQYAAPAASAAPAEPPAQPNAAPAPADVMAVPEPGKEVQDLGMDARILEMARQAGLDLTP